MSYAVDFYARSDLGLVRANNEDSAFAGPRLLALADGMGGHAAGEVASQLMIAALAPLDEDQPGEDLSEALVRAMEAGNNAIAAAVEEDPSRDGMGCTLTALLFDGRRAGLLHVGDSRAYLLRDGELTQITRDDTFVQSMVDAGKLSADEAHSHPQRSLILKALTGQDVEPTTVVREVRPGDRYLLCSDGLSDPVSASTITDTLATGTPAEASERLVSLALRSGGPDNVSVIVADIVDSTRKPAARPMVVGAASSENSAPVEPANSAAARAAAFTRSQASKNAADLEGDKVAADEDLDRGKAEARGKKKTRRILPIVVVLCLLAAGAVAGAMLLRSNYFVTADNSRVVIKQGISGEAFGIPFAQVAQLGCLDRDGRLTVVDADAMPQDCNVFTVSDLREGARAQVQAGLPAGSLSEASMQLTRLATTELLPPCAETGAGAPGVGSTSTSRAATSGAPKPGEPSSGTAAPGASGEPKPGEAKPGEAKPGESKPAEPSAEPKPGEPGASSAAPSTSGAPSSAPGRPTEPQSPGVNCRAVS